MDAASIATKGGNEKEEHAVDISCRHRGDRGPLLG